MELRPNPKCPKCKNVVFVGQCGSNAFYCKKHLIVIDINGKKIKGGFSLDNAAEILDTVYHIGSPYPKELFCRWYARNSEGQKLLIEEKILKCNET